MLTFWKTLFLSLVAVLACFWGDIASASIWGDFADYFPAGLAVTTITAAFAQEFASTVHHTVQAKKHYLDDSVTKVYGVNAAAYNFELLGTSEMQPRVRGSDTSYADDTHSNTLAVLKPFSKALLVDREDKVRTLIQPQNEYSVNITRAYNRRQDKSVYDECLKPTTTASINAASNAGLTFTLVDQVRVYFGELDCDEEDRFFGFTDKSLTNLLSDAKLSSADYQVGLAILNAATIPADLVWMGFKWRRLPAGIVTRTTANSLVDTETLYAWHKSAVGMAYSSAEGELAQVRIDVLPGKNYATQVYGATMLGGACIEPALVVPVLIDYAA